MPPEVLQLVQATEVAVAAGSAVVAVAEAAAEAAVEAVAKAGYRVGDWETVGCEVVAEENWAEAAMEGCLVVLEWVAAAAEVGRMEEREERVGRAEVAASREAVAKRARAAEEMAVVEAVVVANQVLAEGADRVQARAAVELPAGAWLARVAEEMEQARWAAEETEEEATALVARALAEAALLVQASAAQEAAGRALEAQTVAWGPVAEGREGLAVRVLA